MAIYICWANWLKQPVRLLYSAYVPKAVFALTDPFAVANDAGAADHHSAVVGQATLFPVVIRQVLEAAHPEAPVDALNPGTSLGEHQQNFTLQKPLKTRIRTREETSVIVTSMSIRGHFLRSMNCCLRHSHLHFKNILPLRSRK